MITIHNDLHINYQKKVLESICQISEEYSYFLVTDEHLKMSLIGDVSSDLKYISPSPFSKKELCENLFKQFEIQYSLIDKPKNPYLKSNFKKEKKLTFTTGYGVIVSQSDLLVLDIDNQYQLEELKLLCPSIISACKFKRINTDSPNRFHLYYKKPKGFNPSEKIRRINLSKTTLWICGMNCNADYFTYSASDTAHLFRNPHFNYKLVGHMDDITECPSEIVNRIIECEKRYDYSYNNSRE